MKNLVNPSSHLSKIDKAILKVLLEPDGKITSDQLAKKLNLPRATVQRRRTILEKKYLTFNYSLRLDDLGFRRIDLLIETKNGKTISVGKNLLKRDEFVYVGRTVGQHTIDLRTEVVVKDNSELLELLEIVKAMDGVKDVIWTEMIKVIGKKKSIPTNVIDQL